MLLIISEGAGSAREATTARPAGTYCRGGAPGPLRYEWVSLRRPATMEWLPLPQIADSDQSAPSLTIPCQFSGARQGDLTQGQSSGRVFPFATRDLPGRYDGVGDGRSFAQTRLKQWRRCERPPINRETTFHSIVKIKGA